MKKNILFCISHDYMNKGGAETIMRMIASWFIEKGCNVFVFFLKEKITGQWETIKTPNLHLYYTNGGGKWGIFSLVKNFWKVRHLQFDYSFSSIVLNSAIVGVLIRLGIIHVNHMIARESTMVFNRYSGFQLRYRKFLYKVGYKPASLIICQNTLMREQLLQNQTWMKRSLKTEVIPNPVDYRLIHKMEQEQIDLSSLDKYIVTAGRFIPEKGYDILITAFGILLHTRPDLKLIILGDGGSKKESISKQIKERNLERNVILYGRVDNVYPYFRQAQLCVISSRIEGFPNVLLQMMSQNERVVSTTCAGGIEKICGLVTCPPNNVQALYEAMSKALTMDASQNRALFDKELQSRSMDKFMEKVFQSCQS